MTSPFIDILLFNFTFALIFKGFTGYAVSQTVNRFHILTEALLFMTNLIAVGVRVLR